jgi:hypothetical protein
LPQFVPPVLFFSAPTPKEVTKKKTPNEAAEEQNLRGARAEMRGKVERQLIKLPESSPQKNFSGNV